MKHFFMTRPFVSILIITMFFSISLVAPRAVVNAQKVVMAHPTELPVSLFKGEKVFLMGGSGSTGFYRNIWSSAGNLNNWSTVAPNVPWLGNNFCAAYFNGKIFAVVPWFYGANNVNQVYSSTNGVNWSLIQSSAPFSDRNSYSCAVYNNRIWLAGGQELNSLMYKNDVWSTGDGINWTESTSSAPWQARGEHNLVSFQNKLWILAGNTGSLNMLGDIWSSTDGANWTHVDTDSSNLGIQDAPWQARMDTSVSVQNNKLWVMGGLGQSLSYLSDVWSSPDGLNWTHIDTDSTVSGIQDAPWTPRGYHQSMAFGGKLWVLGGNDAMGNFLNDVWYSTNGINWTESTASAQWLGRFGHQVVVTPANFGHTVGNSTYDTLDINAIQ